MPYRPRVRNPSLRMRQAPRRGSSPIRPPSGSGGRAPRRFDQGAGARVPRLFTPRPTAPLPVRQNPRFVSRIERALPPFVGRQRSFSLPGQGGPGGQVGGPQPARPQPGGPQPGRPEVEDALFPVLQPEENPTLAPGDYDTGGLNYDMLKRAWRGFQDSMPQSINSRTLSELFDKEEEEEEEFKIRHRFAPRDARMGTPEERAGFQSRYAPPSFPLGTPEERAGFQSRYGTEKTWEEIQQGAGRLLGGISDIKIGTGPGPAWQASRLNPVTGEDPEGTYLSIPPDVTAQAVKGVGQFLEKAEEEFHEKIRIDYMPLPNEKVVGRDEETGELVVNVYDDTLRYGEAPDGGVGGIAPHIIEQRRVPISSEEERTIVGKGSVLLKASVMGSLGTLNVPAQTVERGIGVVAQHTQLGAGVNSVLLPNGKTYERPEGVLSTGAYHPAQNAALVQAGLPEHPGNLREIAHSIYGDTHEVNVALRDATRMTYSGETAQLRYIARVIDLGEEPNKAMYGDGDFVGNNLVELGWFDNKETGRIDAIKAHPLSAYYYERRKSEGATDVEIADELVREGLPGESNPLMEAVGQTLLDPLMWTTGVLGLTAATGRANRAYRLIKTARITRRTLARMKKFAPTALNSAEVLRMQQVGMTEAKFLGDKVPDYLRGWLPGAPTRTAIRAKMIELASDGASAVFLRVKEVFGASKALGKTQTHGVKKVAQAMLDLAEPKPVIDRYPGKQIDGDGLKQLIAVWEHKQDQARILLTPYPEG